MQPGLHILFLALFTCTSSHVRAETQQDFANSIEQSIQSGSADPNQAPQLQPVPSIIPGKPAPPPADRKNSNGAAQALAMAGAAMAMAMCAKLMNDAKEARAAGQLARADQLEMMAMMQCAQGMKDMGAAQDNGDNKQQLSMNDTPKMAQLAAQPAQSPQASPSQPNVIQPLPSTSELPEFESPEAAVAPAAKTAVKDPNAVGSQAVVGPEYSKTILDAIDQGELKFDDNAKNSGTNGTSGTGSAFFSSQSIPKVPTGEEAKKAGKEGSEEETRKRAKAEGNGEDAEGDASSSPAAAKEGGENSFESMMSQMFGAPPVPGAAFPAAGADDIAAPGASNGADGDEKSNIFQYASYRFQVLAYSDAKIKPRVMPKQKSRELASAFSAEITAVIEGALGADESAIDGNSPSH